MPKKQYTNYDNTLFGKYIRQIENPDSIGWNPSTRRWNESTRNGDDKRNRGMGVDILNNGDAKDLTQGRAGKYLTEAEENQLRNKHIEYLLGAIERHKDTHPGLVNMSPRKQAEVLGALYRGDAKKLWNRGNVLGDALNSKNEEDFHQAIGTYYNSIGLGERARNNDKFWSNQTHSNQSPHVPSPTITRQIDGMVFPTMPTSQPTITKQDVVDAAMLGPKAVATGVGTVANYINQAVQKYVKPKDNSKDNTVRWAEGGFLKPKDAWDALSMKDKADMIGIAVKHGITTLSDIRDRYNEFAEGGNLYDVGGYAPSESIKKRISRWEGDAMVKDTIDPLSGKMAKKNRPFEEVTRGFVRALPSSIAERVLSNPELADNLYSYAYNVGPGNFKKRVVPVLEKFYNGDATIDDVTSSMWASGDKKLRGLRNRRAEEKAGVRNALLGHAATSTVLEPTTPTLVATNNYVSGPYPLPTEEVQSTPLFYHIEDRSTDISSSPEELERQERREALDRFNTVMSFIGIKNPLASYTSNIGNSFLDTLGLFANESANGGKIHIKPSKKGTFTAAAKKHGKSVQAFASQVLAHPDNYSPAMRKKANFARNAAKWHELGGNLFSGEEDGSQKMQIGLRVTNNWKPFTLGDVLANASRIEQQKQVMEDRFSNDLVLSNDATSVANGRPQNTHLERRAVEGAKAHRAWEEEHPNLTAWSNLAGAVPFAVAAAPAIIAGGEAAAGTATGQAITSGLNFAANAVKATPYVSTLFPWAEAAFNAGAATHGVQELREGTFTPMTALELSPLVQPIVGIGNNLYLPHLREHIYASKAPIGYDGVIKAAGRIAEGVLSGKRADIENPFWFNPKSAEVLQSYSFIPNSIQGAEREQYLKEFGEKALRARADIWRMYNRLPQKYNTFIKSEKFPEAYTAPDDIKALHWVPQPKEYIDPGDFVNSVGGNVGLPEITNLGRGIPEPGYSSKEFGVTTLTDLWDLHPFSRPGDRLISRLKRQWNSSTYKAANAIRKVVGSNYIKDGSGTYIPVPNSHTYITKLEDVDLFDTGASIGQVQSTSPTLVSKAPSKIAQRTANKILKLADKVENIEAPNFTILKPIDNKLAKFEIGRLFRGKPVLVKNEIPWTMDRKFIDTDGNIGFQSSWTQGFNSTNILPQSVIDWKRGYLPALLEEPNINPDIFKYLTR